MSSMPTGVGSPGPLSGLRVLELGGIGPGPFAAMLLADMGADVIRVERPGTQEPFAQLLYRGRRSLALDLKKPDARDVVLRLVGKMDVLIEGFRPGVVERLGVGPDDCVARNKRLVYGRVTGWGQQGPLSAVAGHDINYIALSGALGAIGRRGQPPVPPVNFLGDFGGGGMLLAFGVLCALHEAGASGEGQVVDAAMVDGTALLTTPFYSLLAEGLLYERGTNGLDTGAHFYEVYECADGQYVSIGAIEPQFYSELRDRLGLDGPEWDAHLDRDAWPKLKVKLAEVFLTRTRAEWCKLLEGTDVCFAPVLTWFEAHEHPHNSQRGTFVTRFGALQPAPAPRFSRTPGALGLPPPVTGEHSDEVLLGFGFAASEVADLRAAGVVK